MYHRAPPHRKIMMHTSLKNPDWSMLHPCTTVSKIQRKMDLLVTHRAQLVPGWVTVSRFNSRCRTFISVCDQPLRSTQPGHPFVGRCNEYQPKCGDTLRLRSKGRYGPCVGGR